jgi:hypothetical protein
LICLAVQAQQADFAEEEHVPNVEEQRIPDEPPVQGGVLSEEVETRLEPIYSFEDLDSLPFDNAPVNGNGAFRSSLTYSSSISR